MRTAVAPDNDPRENHAFFVPIFARAFGADLAPVTVPSSREDSFLCGVTVLCSVELREKPLDVEGLSDHCELALLRIGPLLAGAVPGEFDAVLVRVAKVEGLGDAVVGGTVYGIPGIEDPLEGPGELSTLGVEDGEVEESRGSPGRGWDILASPGVEADVMVVAAGGEEHGVLPVPLGDFESQQIPVEAQGALDICHLQVNVP